MSAVNFSEVVGKIAVSDVNLANQIYLHIRDLGIEVVPFDLNQASLVGILRIDTKDLGLSLGDRACLALTFLRMGRAVTADRQWEKVGEILYHPGAVPVGVEVIR